MHNKTEVAILLATYNGERFLQEQLTSIFAQSYQDFTLYVADDASSDTTVEIVRKFQEKYPQRIHYTINDRRVGFVKNFENLLEKTKEKYIFFCDQDDIWLPSKIEAELKAMKEAEQKFPNRPIMVHSDLSMIDENGVNVSNSYFSFRGYTLKMHKDLGHILGPCGVIGNTMLINQHLRSRVLPFPSTLDAHDYWIAVVNELFGIRVTLNTPLVAYRIHQTNTSNSTHSLKKKKKFFSRDIQLPNMHTKRKEFLPSLLPSIENEKDKKILQAYLRYLSFKENPMKLYWSLLHYSLIKRSTFFRIKLFVKMLWSNKYVK